MFEALNSVLQSYQLKPIKEYHTEQKDNDNQPCIVFFTLEKDRVSLLLAISKILPKCAFIVPDPTWIKVAQSAEKSVLYLLEGIGINEFGQCFHAKFEQPKKITFICNFFTEDSLDDDELIHQDKAKKFQLYESLTDCPMSSGIELEQYTNDKLHTRLLAAAKNVSIPQTMAFCFSLVKYSHHPVNSKLKLIPLSRDISIDEIQEYLTAFPADKFVIKPSGTRWMGSRLVSIESKDNLDRAVENFKKCLDALQDNDCLLVDEFIDSSITDNSKLGARLRVYVTRRPNNVVETSGIICSFGYLEKGIGGGTSDSFSIDYLCTLLQLTNDQKSQLIDKIKRLGEAVLESIITYETQCLTHIPQNKQTNFIGLDVFLKNHNGILEPFLIEVNDQDCIGILQTYQIQHAPNQTNILDKWVETMLYRSYQYMLLGKNILMIGGGSFSQQNVFELANKVGNNIILIDSDSNHFAINHSTHFFNVDIDNHTKDIEKALAIVEIVRKHCLTVDGVVTFCEANVPLSNLVAKFLGKPASDYQNTIIAQSQFLTYSKVLFDDYSKNFYEPRFPKVTEVFVLKNVADIHKITLHYYPLVIKLDTSYSTFDGELVQTEEELIAKFEEYKSHIQNSTLPDVELGLNYKIIATPYLQDYEHDVDLIISDGELLSGYVTDNGFNMTNLARVETAIMPSLLDKEKQENLIRAAWKTCYDMGLNNGVFNVKAIHTTLGVKIIKINPLMADSYTANWLFNIWDVDHYLYTYLIACGIKPFVNKNSLPRQYYIGFLCYASSHKDVIDESKLKKLSSERDFCVVLFEKEIPSAQKGEKPYACVATYSRDIREARRKMRVFLEENMLKREEYSLICED